MLLLNPGSQIFKAMLITELLPQSEICCHVTGNCIISKFSKGLVLDVITSSDLVRIRTQFLEV